MSDEFEEKISNLKWKNELADQELSLEQKRAMIREAKSRYGRDWKKILGVSGNIRINRDVLQNLHSMGVCGEEVRELTRITRRKK